MTDACEAESGKRCFDIVCHLVQRDLDGVNLAVAPIEADQTKLVLSVTPDGGLLFPPQKGDVWRTSAEQQLPSW